MPPLTAKSTNASHRTILSWLSSSQPSSIKAMDRECNGKENDEDKQLDLAIALSKRTHAAEQSKDQQLLQQFAARPTEHRIERSALTMSRSSDSRGKRPIVISPSPAEPEDNDFQPSPTPHIRLGRQSFHVASNSKSKSTSSSPAKSPAKSPTHTSAKKHAHHRHGSSQVSASTTTTSQESIVKLEREATDQDNETLAIDNVATWLDIKQEKSTQEMTLEIDNVSQWLSVKEEPATEEEVLQIDNLSEWLHEEMAKDTPRDPTPDTADAWQRVSSPPPPATSRSKKSKGKRRADDHPLPQRQPSSISDTLIIPKRQRQDNKKTHATSSSASEVKDGQPVMCPLCSQYFPPNIIENHADACSSKDPFGYEESDTFYDCESDVDQERGTSPIQHSASFSSLSSLPELQTRQDKQPCPLCNALIDVHDLERHVNEELEGNSPAMVGSGTNLNDAQCIDIEDDESDCSVIDLCDMAPSSSNVSVGNPLEEDVEEEEEEDSGYLSPLEGFVTMADQQRLNPLFEHYMGVSTDGSTSRTNHRQGRGVRRRPEQGDQSCPPSTSSTSQRSRTPATRQRRGGAQRDGNGRKIWGGWRRRRKDKSKSTPRKPSSTKANKGKLSK